MHVKDLLWGLADLVYPKFCIACGLKPALSAHLCLPCLGSLPLTDFHKFRDNPVESLFTGRVLLQRATAFLHFENNGPVQKMMHAFKYQGRAEIGSFLGALMGRELNTTDFLQGIDYLVPVPLHPEKLKKRGYNQSAVLAQAVSRVTGIPCREDCLFRNRPTDSQTKKSRYERWQNVTNVFALQDERSVRGKHIMLMDDVVTTGSTLEGCALSLLSEPGVRVSLLTLAYAK